MNELHRKLIATARRQAPDERVPYAFEKRIMARITSSAHLDTLAMWSHALWRAAVTCLAIMALSGVWTFWTANHQPESNLAAELDSAVLVGASPDVLW
jgi:anti-sigma-K factor RskA